RYDERKPDRRHARRSTSHRSLQRFAIAASAFYFVKRFTLLSKVADSGGFCAAVTRPRQLRGGPRRRGVRRLFPYVRAAADVLREPLELGVRLEDKMTRIGPQVTLAWPDVQVGRDVVALERSKHLERLRERHARVVLAGKEQRRSLYVRDVLQR